MQHIALYLSGERSYSRLTGSTGPLVYPAAHVYAYRALHALTSGREDHLLRAQICFAALYVAALAMVMRSYRAAGVAPWVFPALSLSKRVHSVFVLRLFNDGVAVAGLWGAVVCFQRRWWSAGAVAFALAVGVKMSVLLALPAVGVVLWWGKGRDGALREGLAMVGVQVSCDGLSMVQYGW